MTHKIPYGNWLQELADAIDGAKNGDSIECHNEVMIQHARSYLEDVCPGKSLGFTLQEEDPFGFLEKGVTKSESVRHNREWS